ncbi:NAD-dependent epimerase/dehydratase family protein [Falsiroseomonas sp. E2-1-a4]|uniref:NAD-dependent epimerase/dehydratase family protein n=1 Tax=Falsiroseomonas sp. E2-1-a4 TaxID=3239299 RepID=UPI003F2EE3B6
MCFDYLRHGRADARVARIFNTYGPRMRADDGRIVSNLICQALTGGALTIYGDGTQTRSFCYVSDLIRGLMALMGTRPEAASVPPLPSASKGGGYHPGRRSGVRLGRKPRDGGPQPLFQRHPRTPPEKLLRTRDVGAAAPGIINRKRTEADAGAGFRHRQARCRCESVA